MNKFILSPHATIKQAMRRMAEIGEKQIFVADAQNKLLGALSDGDIRKWILKGGELDEEVRMICNQNPKFVSSVYDIEEVKSLMIEERIECVPVVDSKGIVKEVLTWGEVFRGSVAKQKGQINVPAVIMAGGKGTRLDPFTRILPKPLIPIGNKPVIEVIMDKFHAHGVQKFYLSVNHKALMIKSYFKESGTKYTIHYVQEEKPLGTAGSLSLLEGKIKKTLVVTNSDVIIDIDYAELLSFHKKHNSDLTMVVSLKHYIIPYGVCSLENNGTLKNIKEKPEHDLLVNTGMYVINPELLKLIPKNKFSNITDLIIRAKSKGYVIGVFPIHESAWIDVGQWEEYRKALKLLEEV